MAKVQIGYTDRDGDGSTSAWLTWGKNHLLQKRRFAYDGRRWFYQPDTRSRFIPVTATEVPLPVISLMGELTGLSSEHLRTIHPGQS